MKSHWDNIVAETARDSRKRRGSGDQSELSVYSDLAGNIFNDLAMTNDDESGNDADKTEMSVRITIEEEENEDEEEETNGNLGAKKNREEDDEDADGNGDDVHDGDDVDEEDDEYDDDDAEEAEDEEDGDDEERDDGEVDEDEDDEDNDEGEADDQAVDEIEDLDIENHAEDPLDEYDDPSEFYDHSDGSPEGHESRKSFFDDPHNKISQRSRKSSICSSTQTQTQNETSCRSRWCTIIYNFVSQYPVFIMFITLLNWSFFFGGIIAMNPHPRITLKEPLSPSLSSFPFLTIHPWPTCSDHQDHWRLVSSQFTHQGIQHIGGYTALGLVYGVILEITHPFRSFLTVVVYEAAVIFGCLGHSFISPFDSLVGCSTGVYGLIGCSVSHLVLNEDKLDRRVYYGLGAVLVLQGTFEIVSYFIWFSTDTAYAAHFTSFFVGLFTGISFGITEPKIWKRVIGALGISAFCILSISLIVHYSSNLLRDLSYNLFAGKSCCKKLFDIVSPNLSLADARETFICDAVSVQIKK